MTPAIGTATCPGPAWPWCKPVRPWLGLLHHRVAQAEFIGACRSHEFFQRGELRLPAELTDPAIRQHARSARLDAVQVGQQFLADRLERPVATLMNDALARDPVDPASPNRAVELTLCRRTGSKSRVSIVQPPTIFSPPGTTAKKSCSPDRLSLQSFERAKLWSIPAMTSGRPATG